MVVEEVAVVLGEDFHLQFAQADVPVGPRVPSDGVDLLGGHVLAQLARDVADEGGRDDGLGEVGTTVDEGEQSDGHVGVVVIMDAEAQAAVIVPGSSFPTWIGVCLAFLSFALVKRYMNVR